MPTDNFPVNFLHQSIKLTNEPPEGIRANLRRIYNEIDENDYGELGKPNITKPLLFCLSFFHIVTLERRKFGPMGWNIPYEWMISDYLTSKQMLLTYITQTSEVPFDTLQFLFAIINYGGRITDYNDEKVAASLLKGFFNNNCLEADYVFLKQHIQNPVYKVPDTKTLDGIQSYVSSLPFNDEPEIFGLHKNAKINLNLKNSQIMEDLFLVFEPSS